MDRRPPVVTLTLVLAACGGQPTQPPPAGSQAPPAGVRATAMVTGTFDVGPEPEGLAWAAGALWVVGQRDGVLRKADPATGRVLVTAPAGHEPRPVTAGYDGLWSPAVER